MGKLNKKCIICGARYSYCNNCQKDSGKPTWYFIFDGENCHDIYDVCVAYRDKEITIKEAYERISKLDLSDLESFAPSTKAQIEEIMKYNEQKFETKETVVLPKTNNTKGKNRK